MLHRSAFFLLSLPAIAQVPFTHFVVFGDSLSDNGNLYYGTSLLGMPQPGPPSYATGEYTDGTNSVPATTGPLGLWIEQLASKLNLPVPQPFVKAGTNYAVGRYRRVRQPRPWGRGSALMLHLFSDRRFAGRALRDDGARSAKFLTHPHPAV